METFKQYLDASGLREWLDNRDASEVPLVEAKLSRVFHYIEDDKRSFGIVSAYRRENTPEENHALGVTLGKKVTELGYGYMTLRGGVREKKKETDELIAVYEISLLIYNIKKNELIALGVEYNQDSVLYKNKDEFSEIGTSDVYGIETIIDSYHKGAGQTNLDFAKDKIVDYFSSLKYGPHANRRFLFTKGTAPLSVKNTNSFSKWSTSLKVQESEEWSFSKSVHRTGEDPKWITILEVNEEN